MTDNFCKLIDNRLCLSTSAMTEAFCVSERTLGSWAKQGCPKAGHGWWCIADVIRWKGLQASRSGDADVSDGALKLRYEAELKKLQAKQLELRNAIAEGEYISRVEIVGELSRYHIGLKRSLLGLSRRLATEVGSYVEPVVARRIERELSEIVMDALEQMSIGDIYVARKTRKH